MSNELDNVCRILDKLTLDSLTLMEEEIITQLEAEKAMSRGESNLARTRYFMGHNSISALQLPTANGEEFEALVKVSSTKDDKETAFVLEKATENGDKSQKPARWFGVLVPSSLTVAKDAYLQALQWCVKSLNLQQQLKQTCDRTEQLKVYKAQLIAEE